MKKCGEIICFPAYLCITLMLQIAEQAEVKPNPILLEEANIEKEAKGNEIHNG